MQLLFLAQIQKLTTSGVGIDGNGLGLMRQHQKLGQ